MPHLRSARIIQYPLVVVLSLWIAGAGCMLGCEGMVAGATTREVSTRSSASEIGMIVSGEACASSKSHDCCARGRAKANTKPVQTSRSTLEQSSPSSTGMEGCPLAVNRGAIASSTRRNGEQAAVNAPSPHAATEEFSEVIHPVSTQLRLPNRGHTYLRCCAFLI